MVKSKKLLLCIVLGSLISVGQSNSFILLESRVFGWEHFGNTHKHKPLSGAGPVSDLGVRCHQVPSGGVHCLTCFRRTYVGLSRDKMIRDELDDT